MTYSLDLRERVIRAIGQGRPLAEVARTFGVERRLNFAIALRIVPRPSLVFLNESGAQSNLTRRYGRSLVGSRCTDHTAHGPWKTTTLLSIRLDGVIRDEIADQGDLGLKDQPADERRGLRGLRRALLGPKPAAG